jgi:hypothetical protein
VETLGCVDRSVHVFKVALLKLAYHFLRIRWIDLGNGLPRVEVHPFFGYVQFELYPQLQSMKMRFATYGLSLFLVETASNQSNRLHPLTRFWKEITP